MLEILLQKFVNQTAVLKGSKLTVDFGFDDV